MGLFIHKNKGRFILADGFMDLPELSQELLAIPDADGLIIEELTECPSLGWLNPHFIYQFYDDFLFDSGAWQKSAVNGTMKLGNAEAVGLGGVAILNCPAADNNYVNAKITDAGAPTQGAPFKITKDSGKKLIFSARLKLPDTADLSGYIGLIDPATTRCGVDDTGARNMTDGIYFRILCASPTEIDFGVCKNSAETEVKGNIATNGGVNAMTFALHFDGVNMITPVIDGVAKTADTVAADAANFPDDVALTPMLYFHTGEAVVKNLYIDRVRAAQMR